MKLFCLLLNLSFALSCNPIAKDANNSDPAAEPVLQKFTYTTRSDLRSEKIAIIVEPREHPSLPLTVKNNAAILGKEWPIQIFHGKNNKKFVQTQFADLIQEERIILTEMSVENLSLADYNTMMLRKDFWDEVRGDHVLKFEVDASLCSGSSQKIDDFLQYDYVGAPWTPGFQCSIYSNPDDGRFYVINKLAPEEANRKVRTKAPQMKPVFHTRAFVGNSGLSLRKKDAILKVVDSYVPLTHELRYRTYDIFLACIAEHAGLNYAPVDIAKTFSVEPIYFDSPLGFHKPWDGLSQKQLIDLNKSCPILKDIHRNYVGKGHDTSFYDIL